jgi:hypothetical protein
MLRFKLRSKRRKTALSASVVASARVRSITSTEGKITLLLWSQESISASKKPLSVRMAWDKGGECRFFAVPG